MNENDNPLTRARRWHDDNEQRREKRFDLTAYVVAVGFVLFAMGTLIYMLTRP